MSKRHTHRVGNLESLFIRLEELVLANSGEDEFEEIFKLLIAKLWDERSPKPGRFKEGRSESDTFESVLALIREAEAGWPGIFDAGTTPLLTPDHLHICVQALTKHTLSDAGLAVMDSFFEFLVSKGAKGSKGQYFTPRHVVEFCVRMLRPRQGETVLDPACGSGGFLIHALNSVLPAGGLGSESALRNYCISKIWGFDLDLRAVRVAKALMVLAGGGSANIIHLNSLQKPETVGQGLLALESDTAPTLTIEDVCRSRMRHFRGFDLILTNPPFAGEVREGPILDAYKLARGRPRVERDVLFLERCIELLRPGGRMAIVLPHNKFATEAFGHIRQWLLRKARILAVVGLGRNTFLPHTHQKASILFAQKNDEEGPQPKDGKIFFAVSERAGKDSKGQFIYRPAAKDGEPAWDRIDQDLSEIVDGFQEFCKTESLLAEV